MKMIENKKALAEGLKEGECYVIDAPGIGCNLARVAKHIEDGGKVLHKMSPDEKGDLQPADPKGVWPNQ
jgi:hypothetical protein